MRTTDCLTQERIGPGGWIYVTEYLQDKSVLGRVLRNCGLEVYRDFPCNRVIVFCPHTCRSSWWSGELWVQVAESSSAWQIAVAERQIKELMQAERPAEGMCEESPVDVVVSREQLQRRAAEIEEDPDSGLSSYTERVLVLSGLADADEVLREVLGGE